MTGHQSKPVATALDVHHTVNAKLTTTAEPGTLIWSPKEVTLSPTLQRQMDNAIVRYHQLPEWYRQAAEKKD